MKYSLVTPTNRIVHSVKSYAENFIRYRHDVKDVKIIIVDDYSPFRNKNLELVREVTSQYGIECEYWTIEMQKDFFKRSFGNEWKKYWHVIPHRTDACRSFGYLIANQWGTEVIITFDDDNWPLNYRRSVKYDYLRGHSLVNQYTKGVAVSSDKEWVNTCSFLDMEPSEIIYARGYPYYKRSESYAFSEAEGRVVMNAGLWLRNPDVDSVYLLSEGSMNGLPHIRAVGLKQHTRLIIARRTMAPLNTANTAYSRDLLPCIYDTFQGAKVGEFHLDRFGDIWCNLFIKKIVDQVGDIVTIRLPLVEHRREPRDTFIDFKKEIWGIIVSERLFELVEKIELNSKTYYDNYSELINKLQSCINDISNINSIQKYFRVLLESMIKWTEIIDKLNL